MKRSLHIQIYTSRLISYRKNYKGLLLSEQKSVWSEWLWKGYKNFVRLSMQLRLQSFIFLLPFFCNAKLNETFYNNALDCKQKCFFFILEVM